MFKKLWLKITPMNRRVLGVSLFLMLTGNVTFFTQVSTQYPLAQGNAAFLTSVSVLFTAATCFFLMLLVWGKRSNWTLLWFTFASASAAYFMDRYNAVIDSDMLVNLLQTNVSEASDLLSVQMGFRLLLLGILPGAYFIWRPVTSKGFWPELKSKAVVLPLLLVVMVACIVPFTSKYATFFREHKTLRFYANPTYYSYSLIRLAHQTFKSPESKEIAPVALDAKMTGTSPTPRLAVMVVGETARADRFSLNGYSRPTNPLLAQAGVLSFAQVTSCGTSTAISVPCMFSALGMKDFDLGKATRSENALDVLARLGVEVIWRDNNSDSKGVAVRLNYQDYKDPKVNTVCDDECRDMGLLVGLDDFVQSKAGKDVLIVLHQMGNHGPAYYKRYPAEFEKFKPVCKTNELSKCTPEELNNAYDNVVLYTDYFLNQIIEFLKKYDASHQTAMLYVSDHGESLGEFGMYLHGAPRAFAPKEQTHVPAVLWLGAQHPVKLAQLSSLKNTALSHDDLFCTLLGNYSVKTELCQPFESRLKTLGVWSPAVP